MRNTFYLYGRTTVGSNIFRNLAFLLRRRFCAGGNEETKGDIHEPRCPLLFRPFYQLSFSIKKGVVEHCSRQIHGHSPRRGLLKAESTDYTISAAKGFVPPFFFFLHFSSYGSAVQYRAPCHARPPDLIRRMGILFCTALMEVGVFLSLSLSFAKSASSSVGGPFSYCRKVLGAFDIYVKALYSSDLFSRQV